jgi:hypothetical protein
VLKLIDVVRWWAVLNGSDMFGERGDTSLIHHVAYKLERGNIKHPFGGLMIKPLSWRN